MYIRCWGSRGSIPVSGSEFNKYGGNTTCIEIRSSEGDLLVIDAGSGIRELGDKLILEKTRKIHHLFTHLHLDHIVGLPFFGPILKRGVNIFIYGCPFKLSSFQDALHGVLQGPYCPVDLKKFPSNIQFKDIQNKTFKIGSLEIRPIYLNHPNGGLGYRFEENGKTFVFLTDNELGYDLPGSFPFEEYIDFCKDADLLIHDAQYTKEEYLRFKAWGHSSIMDALELGIRAGVKRLGLFHIDSRRTDKQLDQLVEEAQKVIVKRKHDIECFAVGNTFEIEI